MRRLLPFIAALTLVVGISGPTSAASTGCSITVDPRAGGSNDEFVLQGRGFPSGTFEEPVHVLVEVRYPGRDGGGTIYFVHLAPGSTWFDVTFHEDLGMGEPFEPLAPGRYRVFAEDDEHTCSDRTSFLVRFERPQGRRVL